MPDSPGSCANTVGADGAGMAPPVKASVKSAYVHRPDSTQYHPEGEGGTKPKRASVARATVALSHSVQNKQAGEGDRKPKHIGKSSRGRRAGTYKKIKRIT